VGATYYSLAQWLANYDTTNSYSAQPTFTSYSYRDVDNDLHLSAIDTAAIDNGIDLSSYFTADKAGVPRGTAWDIGAYEYTSGARSASLNGPGSAALDGAGSLTIQQ
jgi:hypothetical protein